MSVRTIMCAALTLVLGLGIVMPVAAAEATLKVGDPAPKLGMSKWIKGDPVKEIEKDKIYVVEFWATWCGPCRVSIPHLTKLQKEYKDKNVIVIGQDCWEEKQDAVAAFVEQMGDKMDYRVALDDMKGAEKGVMATTWMEAAGQNGIPTAFIVDKGLIAWIGHPMAMDGVLAKVVAGTYDAKKAAEDAQVVEKFGMLLMKEKDYEAAYKLGDKLYEALKDEPKALNELAWVIATEEGIQKRDLDLAEKLAARGVEVSKGEDAAVLDTLARVHFEKGNLDKAIELQKKAVAKADDDLKDDVTETLKKYEEAKKAKADK